MMRAIVFYEFSPLHTSGNIGWEFRYDHDGFVVTFHDGIDGAQVLSVLKSKKL